MNVSNIVRDNRNISGISGFTWGGGRDDQQQISKKVRKVGVNSKPLTESGYLFGSQ